jgi:hypothetical protein
LFKTDKISGEERMVQNADEFNEAATLYHETIISIAATYQEDPYAESFEHISTTSV